MVFNYSSIVPSNPEPGVTRRVLAHAPNLMAVEVTFEKGAVGAVHRHPHEQATYVVSGAFTYEEDGKTCSIAAGDSYYVAPNVAHGVVCLEPGVLLDIFTPQREDFL